MRTFAAGILLLVSLLFVFTAAAETPGTDVDRVVVYKHERRLVLLSHGKELRSYKVTLGSEPIGPKTRQGDHRTPEGV
jgi:murein L,D-transpeptidase YafK